MMIKKIFPVLGLLLLVCSVVSAQGDRPDYPFGDEPFKLLPPFPEDFFSIKHLFEYQMLKDWSRLTEDYYKQPEFYPLWFEQCNITYGRNETEERHHGVYGYGVYPSHFSINNAHAGDSVVLTAILHASWGVEINQGVLVIPQYNDTVLKVEILEPDNCPEYYDLNASLPDNQRVLFLRPTYPQFNPDWALKLVFRVTVLKDIKRDYQIQFYDGYPPPELDNFWREKYGLDYVSGGSELERIVPRLTVDVLAPPSENDVELNHQNVLPDFDNNLLAYIGIFILILVIIVLFVVVRRR